MKLELSQIKEITLGAARVEENEDGFEFFRFTEEQEEMYKKYKEDFYYQRTYATSGVKFWFVTNSEKLSLTADVPFSCARRYFSFDVFVNEKMIGSLNNFSDNDLSDDYITQRYELGEFSKEFSLGAGEKEVCIYFPWSVKAVLKDFELDDNSVVLPIKPKRSIICYGDSITQGVDALHSNNKYTTQLANIFDAEEYNKAICGDIFFPQLAAAKDNFEPYFITVAYGTNDWSRCSKEEFIYNCKEFYSNLSKNYPKTKIFALTPLWRKDMCEERQFGAFETVGETIKSLTEEFDNVIVLDGFNFVPHDENYYADRRLHPNDKGFSCYFENLAKQIKNYL